MKIDQIKDIKANAGLGVESRLSGEEVQMLKWECMSKAYSDSEAAFRIVADSEADMKAKSIAISTPIAHGLLGHKKGEIVEITIPAGNVKFEIIEIGI